MCVSAEEGKEEHNTAESTRVIKTEHVCVYLGVRGNKMLAQRWWGDMYTEQDFMFQIGRTSAASVGWLITLMLSISQRLSESDIMSL